MTPKQPKNAPMNSRKPSPVTYCAGHSGHEAILRGHTKQLDDNHEEHGELWKTIREKVNLKIFSLFVILFVGNMGFQLLIYDKVKDVGTTVAVIQSELKSHSRYDSPIETKDRLNNGGR